LVKPAERRVGGENAPRFTRRQLKIIDRAKTEPTDKVPRPPFRKTPQPAAEPILKNNTSFALVSLNKIKKRKKRSQFSIVSIL